MDGGGDEVQQSAAVIVPAAGFPHGGVPIPLPTSTSPLLTGKNGDGEGGEDGGAGEEGFIRDQDRCVETLSGG